MNDLESRSNLMRRTVVQTNKDDDDAAQRTANDELRDNDGEAPARYGNDLIDVLRKKTNRRKLENDSFMKRTHVLKFLKHRAQRIGHQAASKEAKAHFKKAVQKVLELSIHPEHRTDHTLDVNLFLNDHFERIIETFNEHVLTKEGTVNETNARSALTYLFSHVDGGDDDCGVPDHVVALTRILADFTVELRNELEKICRTTALTKAQEHWRDRLPLVFVFSTSLFVLKIIHDSKRIRESGGRVGYVDLASVVALCVAYVMSHVLVYYRVAQSIYADALKGGQDRYNKFKDSIPNYLRDSATAAARG